VDKRYGAAMAAHLKRSVQVVLQIGTGKKSPAQLRALTDGVRLRQAGAFRALVAALAPLLVSWANRFEEDEPGELLDALFQVVEGGAATVVEIQSAIRTLYRTKWESRASTRRRDQAWGEEQALLWGDTTSAPDDPEPPLAGYVASGVITAQHQYVLVGFEIWGWSLVELAQDLNITHKKARELIVEARKLIREAGLEKRHG
jgi:hypothetical protein